MHTAKRKVRGFQEWQPAFARSHIRTVGNPDATKHSETYQESMHNTLPQLSLFTPRSRLKWQSTSLAPKPTSTRPYEPSLMDSSRPSTTGRSSTPYSLRAYRTPMRPYRTASRNSNARLTIASSSHSIPSAMRTTMGASPPRSPSEAGTTPMPSGSSSATMAVSTSSLGRTLTSSPTPQTSSLTHLTQMRSLHCTLAGSATYSPAPLLPTTPYARQYLTSTTGMPSLRLSDTTATTTTANVLPTSSCKSSVSSPSSMTPLPPPATEWKWHKFLLSFLTLRDALTRSHTQDIGLLTSVAAMAMLTMDREIHSRQEGDVIASYRQFNVRAMNGRKCKSPGD